MTERELADSAKETLRWWGRDPNVELEKKLYAELRCYEGVLLDSKIEAEVEKVAAQTIQDFGYPAQYSVEVDDVMGAIRVRVWPAK